MAEKPLSPAKDPSLTEVKKESDRRGPAPFRANVFHDLGIFLRLVYHFWRGFRFMRSTRRAITIFGSARLPATHPAYENARSVAHHFARQGFSIITGGGPSLMEAANRGAQEAGGRSIGINIEIPYEQRINPYVNHWMKTRYFFVRKVLLCRYSEAFVIYPGGLGTLDEFFELTTLMKTGKMLERPLVLVDRNYWKGLIDWIHDVMLPAGTVSLAEFKRIHVVDTVDEVTSYLAQRLYPYE